MKTMITFSENFDTVYVSKTFRKNASIYGTPEFKKLLEIRKQFGDIKIAVHSNSNKNRRLTYKAMQTYIAVQPNAEAVLKEMKRITEESKVQRNPYLFVQNWFLTHYPDYQEPKVACMPEGQSKSEEGENVVPLAG